MNGPQCILIIKSISPQDLFHTINKLILSFLSQNDFTQNPIGYRFNNKQNSLLHQFYNWMGLIKIKIYRNSNNNPKKHKLSVYLHPKSKAHHDDDRRQQIHNRRFKKMKKKKKKLFNFEFWLVVRNKSIIEC